MSRAFVKEADGSELEALPDRLISQNPNFVTEVGLAQIESEVARLKQELAEVQAIGEKSDIARVSRDFRYWTQRQSSAEVIPASDDISHVRFGSTVTFEREDGRKQTYRIVGEDEADPTKGTISYVSPLAHALMGKQVQDIVQAGQSEVEVIDIS